MVGQEKTTLQMILVRMEPQLEESRSRLLLQILSCVGKIQEDLVHGPMLSVEGAACPDHGLHTGAGQGSTVPVLW